MCSMHMIYTKTKDDEEVNISSGQSTTTASLAKRIYLHSKKKKINTENNFDFCFRSHFQKQEVSK